MKLLTSKNIEALPLFILSALMLCVFFATNSFAQDVDVNQFSKVMCRVLDIARGTGGKAFAAFAIISVGIGFFTGKVSWGLMIGVAAGIAVIFGAPSIVAAISGEGGDCKCPYTGHDGKNIYDAECVKP